MSRSGYAIKGGLGCNNFIAYEQEFKILLLLGHYITARPSVIPPKQVVIVMCLHLFSGPGWPDAARAEAGHAAVWTMSFSPRSALRRPASLRADLSLPRLEGHAEKRWRDVSSL